jgi:hypothetical protein
LTIFPTMNLKSFLTFEANLSADEQWDEDENLIVPGGRLVSEAICEAVRNMGMRASTPEQHSFYSWSFDIQSGRCRVWCVLQGGKPWLLQTEPRRSVFDVPSCKRFEAEHRAVLDSLNSILSTDPRFSDANSFTKDEYECHARSQKLGS